MTSEQIDSLALPRPWVGPDGDVQGELDDHRYPGRKARKALPEGRYGALLAGASLGSEPPHAVFSIGAFRAWQADRAGWLWFAVNDVYEPPSLFLDDNLGMFFVHVQVVRAH